jgi:DNA-binding NtrC family response regulator
MANKKKTILAIDDDVTILTNIRAVLERHYDVSLAKNIYIAKTILHTTRVKLILLDMEMPGLSGMDFLEYIHTNPDLYHIPVIVVSSHGSTDVIVDAKKRGAVDFIVKPFSSRVLLDKIRFVLNAAKIKIFPDDLGEILNRLKQACITGNSGSIDDIIDELDMLYCDLESDVKVAEVCKHARNMDYNLVNEKLNELFCGILIPQIQ